jgi:hypothetical protein
MPGPGQDKYNSAWMMRERTGRRELAVPSQHMWMDRRLSADIMYSQAGLSYMKEGLASNGPARIL